MVSSNAISLRVTTGPDNVSLQKNAYSQENFIHVEQKKIKVLDAIQWPQSYATTKRIAGLRVLQWPLTSWRLSENLITGIDAIWLWNKSFARNQKNHTHTIWFLFCKHKKVESWIKIVTWPKLKKKIFGYPRHLVIKKPVFLSLSLFSTLSWSQKLITDKFGHRGTNNIYAVIKVNAE